MVNTINCKKFVLLIIEFENSMLHCDVNKTRSFWKKILFLNFDLTKYLAIENLLPNLAIWEYQNFTAGSVSDIHVWVKSLKSIRSRNSTICTWIWMGSFTIVRIPMMMIRTFVYPKRRFSRTFFITWSSSFEWFNPKRSFFLPLMVALQELKWINREVGDSGRPKRRN